MQKSNKSIRVFQNPFLERLTHVHPLTPLIFWGPFVGWLVWRSFSVHGLSTADISGYGVMGFFSWTLVEYLLHRFIFHFESENPVLKKLHFLIHGIHHDDPNDPTRLVMPPAAGVILATLLYVLFRTFLGPIFVEPFFACFVVGYLCYDYTHFAVHHFVPRTRVGKYLKHSHMQHHYVCPNSRWGVSSPFWDYVFGTLDTTQGNSVHEVKASKEITSKG